MNRLKQKLKSESGASILLAMLFLLICTLIASALLMAAVSNAGKIRSNQEVHQKYLTVSSAMELVCEDLLSGEYCGKYEYKKEIRTNQTNAQGETIEQIVHVYTQKDGEYDCKLGGSLRGNLDAIFAKQMESDVRGFRSDGDIPYTVELDLDGHQGSGTVNPVHIFTVKPAEADGVQMGEVQVTLTLDTASYTINLEARLIGDAAYGMKAELTPISNLPRPTAPDVLESGKTYKTEPMKWKLGWITKA